ncbi:YIP1 family protein [Halobacterium sp. KA-4]|uniref:Yip1 family protein n=1 Tax=Halobacterium sp. KA-4 TaxID=2896367 RepID=UPI001E319EB5|nr:YIP1 family protein [Halobacterium sp. KA-4]MCD2198567.1 YIP1 family protein [Halobacterium sp. KA-4]
MAPRTPLSRPRRYFEERGFDLRPAVAAVGVAALVLAAALYGFAALFVRRVRRAGHGDAASEVWSLLSAEIVGIVVLFFVGWVIVAGILHLLARAVIGHEGTFRETLAVAGWGTVPSILNTVFAFAVLAFVLQSASFDTSETFARQFRSTFRSTGLLRGAFTFVVAGWQTYIYTEGLYVEFDADEGSALVVAAVVAYGGWLLSLF